MEGLDLLSLRHLSGRQVGMRATLERNSLVDKSIEMYEAMEGLRVEKESGLNLSSEAWMVDKP